MIAFVLAIALTWFRFSYSALFYIGSAVIGRGALDNGANPLQTLCPLIRHLGATLNFRRIFASLKIEATVRHIAPGDRTKE